MLLISLMHIQERKIFAKHTCCFVDENSGWLAAITDLNMRGRIPSCF